MFILKASSLISSEKPPLSMNCRLMGRENNQGFELTNRVGDLVMRRPLRHPEERYNPGSLAREPKPTLNS